MKHNQGLPSTPRALAARSLSLVRHPALQLEALLDAALDDQAHVSAVGGPRGDPYPGVVVDQRYVVGRLIGEGWMGRVYECRHRVLGKKLAIKVIRRDLAKTPGAFERFLIEAKAASAVGNEHIIDIVDFGAFTDGAAYLVMEHLDGVPLSRRIDEHGPMPLANIVDIASQIAEGLAAAHAAGIVHRDLKPDNVFLVQRRGHDFVKILDFGVAKITHATAKLTQAGMVAGTPNYMSPEQAAGAPVDARGDIYALGVILYELASGRVPFDADDSLEVLQQHLTQLPPPLCSVDPRLRISAELEDVIGRCLAKRPEERYPSMTALLSALRGLTPRAAASGRVLPSPLPSAALPSSKPELPSPVQAQAPRQSHRPRVGLYLAAALLVAVGAIGWGGRGPSSAVPRPIDAPGPLSPLVAQPSLAVATPAPAQAAPAQASPAQAAQAQTTPSQTAAFLPPRGEPERSVHEGPRAAASARSTRAEGELLNPWPAPH